MEKAEECVKARVIIEDSVEAEGWKAWNYFETAMSCWSEISWAKVHKDCRGKMALKHVDKEGNQCWFLRKTSAKGKERFTNETCWIKGLGENL